MENFSDQILVQSFGPFSQYVCGCVCAYVGGWLGGCGGWGLGFVVQSDFWLYLSFFPLKITKVMH